MGPRRSVRQLWVISSEGTLADLPGSLREGRWRVHRLTMLRFEDRPRVRLRARMARWGHVDTLVITSPRAIESFVRPVLRGGDRTLEVWAAGEQTARELRELGYRNLRRAADAGAEGIANRLGRGRRRSIVYPRSDVAGTALPRRLRRHGHRVLDLVTYRTVPAPRPSAATVRALATADLVLVTSPSAVAALQQRLRKSEWSRLKGHARVVAFGPRTQRSARRRGLRGVGCLSAPSVEGLTAYLAREGSDASE